MQLILISDNTKNSKWFSEIKLPKDFTLEIVPVKERNKYFKIASPDTFFYLDISTLDETENKKIIRQLARLANSNFGVLDSKNATDDIASLFHLGTSDYINRKVMLGGLTGKRIKDVIGFKPVEPNDIPGSIKARTEYIHSGENWSTITKGREYTFSFMFLELDNGRLIKNQLGKEKFSEFNRHFREIIDENVTPYQGKIWMWNEFGGLILFPFNGKSCKAVLPSFRLMLNKSIICYEDLDCHLPLSWRIALHLGNTTYQARGKTGTIIADSINSIFHLGQKYAQPGNLYLTQDTYTYVPDRLGKSLTKAGEYEGREIYQMKIPAFKTK